VFETDEGSELFDVFWEGMVTTEMADFDKRRYVTLIHVLIPTKNSLSLIKHFHLNLSITTRKNA
jgi:hypothetical protein